MRGAFIGRDRELAELAAALQDAIEGRGRVCLITGEPGIGKTALADKLSEDAVERGTRVVWGRCWEGEGAPPYWPWTQIIRAIADQIDDETLRSIASSGAAQIALLVPDLAARLGVSPSPVAIESDARRFYVFEAVARYLKNASAAQPLVLVLDDLHAADRPSLLLLRFLAGDVRATRMLIVATARDVEAARSPETEDAIAALAREGPVLGLRGMDRDEVGRLVEQVSGTVPLQATLTAIHQATEGNPLFVREVTRLVATRDRLDRPGRLSFAIPPSVRSVIRRRMSPLSADAVRVLSAAAVVGRDFELKLVGPASDLSNDRVLESLSEAAALGVVSREPSAVGVYRFTHPLMREVIYDELPIPARTQLHRLVGEAIERLYGEDSRPHLPQLAHHFAEAAPAGEGAKARHYARQAGDRAMDACAYEDAVVEYRRALETWEFAGPDESLRCEVILRLGDALARAGDYEDAQASYLSAGDIARTLGDADRLARAALGFGAPQVEAGVVDRRLVALLQEALDALPPGDGALRARILARMSLELTFSDETELRERLSLEAVETARRLGEVVPLAFALRARWLAVWGPDGLEERTALAEEILALGVGIGDRETEMIGRARRITCSMEAGAVRAAETDILAHAALANELRMPYHQWVAASMRGMLTLLDGDLELAEKHADAALGFLPGRRDAIYAHLNQLTPIRWDQGRLGELRRTWQEIVDTFPQAGFSRGWVCLAEAELGRQDEAHRWLSSLVEAIHELPRNGIWLPAVAVACVAAALLEDPGSAGDLHPLLLPYADQTIVMSVPHPVMCFGPASLYVAMLEAALSRWEEAEDHFASAIREHTQVGARALLARTQLEHAHMLGRRGRSADRGRALDLLDRAAATATALGMHGVLGGIERLRELEGGGAVAAEARGSAFRREGEYWTVIYEGSLVRLRDSKGLRYLAALLTNPGREFHVVDLEGEQQREASAATGSGRRAVSDELEVRSDLGDAGEMLDATAKAAYRAHLEDLQAEVDEAELFNDPARATKAREEIDFIAGELARAVGLGGRDRRAASHAERARLNVTRAIRAAIGNLARANPPLGRHLTSTIRTGRYCSYTPDPRAEIDWES